MGEDFGKKGITIRPRTPPHGFEPGVKWRRRSNLGLVDWICIAIFWACLLWQLITGFVLLGSANYQLAQLDSDDMCPSGYMYAPTQCTGSTPKSTPYPVWDATVCVKEDLCKQISTCIDDSIAVPHHRKWFNRDLSHTNEDPVSPTFWVVLGKYWYIPTVICLGVVVLGVLWLYALQLLVKPIIWSTLSLGVALLVGFWAFWFVEYHVNNWMLLVGAVVELIFMAFCWGSINRSAEVISVASAGLKATPSVLGVSLLVEAMYVGYTALWIVFLITTFHVKEVDGTSCSLDEPSWVAVSRWIYGPMFFIFTYVFLNMKTVVCAVGVGAWYFPDPDAPMVPALKGLQWACTSSSGAIMFASLFVGIVRYVINRITDVINCLPICLSPLACLWSCIASCLLGILEMFSKFMLIGQAFCGEAFCGSARRSFSVVKDRLGDAFITDSIGANVVTMSTYIFSLGLGIASWAWLDSAQDYQTLTSMAWYVLVPVLVLYAFFISIPVLTITLLAWLSSWLHVLVCGSDGECSTGWEVDTQHAINSVTGALFIGSVCYCLFNFIGEVVISSIDTIFFCFAIEYDNDIYQSRLRAQVYEVLRDDCPGGAVPMDGALCQPYTAKGEDTLTTVTGSPQLVISDDNEHTTVNVPTPSAPIVYQRPPPNAPIDTLHVTPVPADQAMIGRPSDKRIR